MEMFGNYAVIGTVHIQPLMSQTLLDLKMVLYGFVAEEVGFDLLIFLGQLFGLKMIQTPAMAILDFDWLVVTENTRRLTIIS
jgi:hypothetical protein